MYYCGPEAKSESKKYKSLVTMKECFLKVGFTSWEEGDQSRQKCLVWNYVFGISLISSGSSHSTARSFVLTTHPVDFIILQCCCTPGRTFLLPICHGVPLRRQTPRKQGLSQYLPGLGLPALSKKLVEKTIAGQYVDFSELPPAKGHTSATQPRRRPCRSDTSYHHTQDQITLVVIVVM